MNQLYDKLAESLDGDLNEYDIKHSPWWGSILTIEITPKVHWRMGRKPDSLQVRLARLEEQVRRYTEWFQLQEALLEYEVYRLLCEGARFFFPPRIE
jgi:hypothetical protein